MAAETGPSAVQGIDANYFNITDAAGMPIAGLLVMLDRLHRPVRAEVHLYDDLTEEGREIAIARARTILQERYVSRTAVPVRILHTFPERTAVNVTLPQEEAQSGAASESGGINWPAVLGVIAALAILTLAVWGITRWLGNRDDTATETPAITAPAATEEGSDDAPPTADTTTGQGSDLPPSRNARSDVQVGTQVEIVPGYQLTLRSEPGPEAGEEVGYMLEGQSARIIDGPVLTQGDSDTIVWWRIQLENGQEAWAAANTSQVTLLVPAAE
jgi:hypothetical protein